MVKNTEDNEPRPRLGECEPLPGLRLIRARAMKDDFRRHSHRSLLVGIVRCGQRRLHMPDDELLVLPGDGFFLPAAVPHRCMIAPAHTYRIVSISPSLWDELMGAPAPKQAKILPAGSPALLAARRLIATMRSNPETLSIETSLLALLEVLNRCAEVIDMAPALPAKVLKVRDWLTAHCAETVRLTTLAEIAGCSPGLINRLFSQYIGLPPYEYLLQLRLGIAAQRLRGGAQTLADIAYDTGFADQSHLQRFFRRGYGTTPKAYRTASSILRRDK
jgi:AraC-like DNA-binding protein